jgi:hypothetical protein
MKKKQKKSLQNIGKQRFISEKMKSRAIVKSLLANEQDLICCVIETGDSVTGPFRTTWDDCKRLAKGVGIARRLPMNNCR